MVTDINQTNKMETTVSSKPGMVQLSVGGGASSWMKMSAMGSRPGTTGILPSPRVPNNFGGTGNLFLLTEQTKFYLSVKDLRHLYITNI